MLKSAEVLHLLWNKEVLKIETFKYNTIQNLEDREKS